MAMPGTRGTTNRNSRGGSDARRRRKQWLLDTFGDGTTAKCEIKRPGCLGEVTFETVWVDRWPVKGCEGGTYRRGNIRPSCAFCNMSDGGAHGRAKQLGRIQ